MLIILDSHLHLFITFGLRVFVIIPCRFFFSMQFSCTIVYLPKQYKMWISRMMAIWCLLPLALLTAPAYGASGRKHMQFSFMSIWIQL